MKSLKVILEDVFSDRIQQVYDSKLSSKLMQRPEDFDRDALQLGVVHELNNYKSFKKALAVAMIKLSKDENVYDDVDPYGRDVASTPVFDRGLPSLGIYGQQ